MDQILNLIGNRSVRNLAVGLIGTSGFAREIMPLIRDIKVEIERMHPQLSCQLMFVDQYSKECIINGYRVVSDQNFYSLEADLKVFNVAIADSRIRAKVAELSESHGVLPLSIVAKSAASYDCNLVGPGAILCANTIITSNAQIGKYFHCNLASYVAHDCVIGDYVTFAPNVHCNGNVKIEDHAYIGTGAIIKQGLNDKPLTIGRGAIVGMGAVVTRDVPPGVTVVGNPARVFQK